MTAATNKYRPDYAVPPGWVLEEELEARNISQAELARRCGRSAKLISEIVAGKAPVEPATAIQFQRVLGVDAGVWLGIESNYRLRLAQQVEAVKAAESVGWAKTFPVRELAARKVIVRPSSNIDSVSVLLSFFAVASVEAWQAKYNTANVAYRRSPAFESDQPAVAAWLRLGEIEAERTECTDYDAAKFRSSLTRLRTLSTSTNDRTLTEAQRLCNESGVVLSFTKPFPKMAISGAAWWPSPRKPLIQLSARHKTDDHLWFSFFHEAAHILLHSKSTIFVDVPTGKNETVSDKESAADAWASNFLIPSKAWEEFVSFASRSRSVVQEFAESQGIAPGIVVGRLQHEGHLEWNRLNHLKTRLQWN